jgi:hypothetical protein
MFPIKKLLLSLCALLFMVIGLPMVLQAADTTTLIAENTQIPQTNAEIRQWYNDQVATIPVLNEQWLKDGLSAEDRAHNAHEIRHAARLKARSFMQNKDEVVLLQARDMEKYGNPDGPTFEQLVQKHLKDGLTGDAVYEEIVGSAVRTNRDYNQKFGVQPQGTAK